MPDIPTPQPTASAVSRRTIAKGLAWTMPAVTFAGTVNAYAASPCTSYTDTPLPDSAGDPATLTITGGFTDAGGALLTFSQPDGLAEGAVFLPAGTTITLANNVITTEPVMLSASSDWATATLDANEIGTTIVVTVITDVVTGSAGFPTTTNLDFGSLPSGVRSSYGSRPASVTPNPLPVSTDDGTCSRQTLQVEASFQLGWQEGGGSGS